MKKGKKTFASIREVIFGLEDGLVSTLGAVTGIAAGAQSTFIVILSGLVLIAVEATSMAAGSYLSNKAVAATEGKTDSVHPYRAAAIMGLFYVFGGLVPITPYFLFPVHQAYLPSIIATAIVLYLIGVWSARYTNRNKVKSGLEMAIVSLAAAFIGYVIGRLVSNYFGVDVI